MKKFVLIILLTASLVPAQIIKLGEARGLFFSMAIGPRMPIGDLSISHNIGIGLNFESSYTDNNFLPLFFYGRFGYQHFPGKQHFYQTTDYSSISSNLFTFGAGARFFFPPVVKQVIIVLPYVEGGLAFAILERLHEFKIGSPRSDYTETKSMTGFQLGGGLSMFLIDVGVYYNYFYSNQYLSFNLRIRVPVAVKI